MKRLFSLKLFTPVLLAATLLFSGCAKDKNGERLIFSIEDDIALGNKVAAETDSIYRSKGQLIERTDSRANVKQAYANLDRILNRVLSSNKISYRNEFGYEAKIIKDDKTLNAFATPGGHIYVFTGLIKSLEHEDELAGVLGHEIAHADRRHTSKQLEKQYGLNLLLSVLLGENQNQLVDIAANLATLKFSRDAETEADFYSVEYLSSTPYTCDGAAYFFQRMQDSTNTAKPPVFLSTHPSDASRIQAITDKAKQDNCSHVPQTDQDYQNFKNSLNF